MMVKQILRDKGYNVVTVPLDATLSEATVVLAQHRIGALVVRDREGRLTGILSERDIIQALARDSVNALTHPVSAHMTRRVSTCSESDTIDDLMELMTLKRFRHVPVMADGRLAGIVSIGDIVKSRIAETEREAENLRGYIAAG